MKDVWLDYVWLIWFDGAEKLDNKTVEEILEQNSLITLRHIDYKILIELSNLDNLSPRVAHSCKQIVLSKKSYSTLEIIYANKQEIMYLLSDSILHKNIDPFTVFYKIIKDLFAYFNKTASKIFVVLYEE